MNSPTHQRKDDKLDIALTRSVATTSLDLLEKISETSIDAVLEAGVLRDIPIIGCITGIIKVGKDIRDLFFLRKIVMFLQELSTAPSENRRKFIERFDSDEKQYEFGQAILMMLDQSEDMKKPRLIAKLLFAHIQGHIDYSKTMRLCSIVSRCYSQDLNLLKEFSDGPQGENTPIAESLFSVGLLSHGGIDGGTWEESPGIVIYVINEYGQLLREHALS